MTILIKMLVVVTAITVIATSTLAQSARHSIYDRAVAKQTVIATNTSIQSARTIRGASPYVAIENEPAPKLIVDPPLPEGLAQGVYWAQYRMALS
jgi:hypothetical protein